MRFDVVCLFPEILCGFLRVGVVGRAIDSGIIRVFLHNLRDYGVGRHRVVDDYPYGGGRGMVLRPEPFFRAVEEIRKDDETKDFPVILLSPQGRLFDERYALELSRKPGVIILCGRYEGVDERVSEHLVDEEVSIGDYILSGGEVASMVIIDCVSRILFLDEEALESESFMRGILEHPQYTRPRIFRGYKVPDVLLSGNHREIELWRKREAIRRTFLRRPELLGRALLDEDERKIYEEIRREYGRGDSGEKGDS